MPVLERTPPASESKNFYAQFSESERIMIEKAEKAAVEEERCSKYLDEYNAKTSASSRKGNNVGAGSTTSSGLTKQTSNEGNSFRLKTLCYIVNIRKGTVVFLFWNL